MACECKQKQTGLMRGFTLIELLIVVVILAVLASVISVQISNSSDDAKEAALDSTLKTLRTAISRYYADHGSYPGQRESMPGPNCTSAFAARWPAGSEEAFREQLRSYTDAQGRYCRVKGEDFPYGPYLKIDEIPVNPITGSNLLVTITLGDLVVHPEISRSPQGWKYDSQAGVLIANDPSIGPDGQTYGTR